MSITELAIHNVLRTYNRQDRLSKLTKSREATASRSADKLELSPVAQKLAAMGRVAEDMVTQESPALAGAGRDGAVREKTEALLGRHRQDVEDRAQTPETFETALRSAYLK